MDYYLGHEQNSCSSFLVWLCSANSPVLWRSKHSGVPSPTAKSPVLQDWCVLNSPGCWFSSVSWALRAPRAAHFDPGIAAFCRSPGCPQSVFLCILRGCVSLLAEAVVPLCRLELGGICFLWTRTAANPLWDECWWSCNWAAVTCWNQTLMHPSGFSSVFPKAGLTWEAKILQSSEHLQTSLAFFLVFMAMLGALRNPDLSLCIIAHRAVPQSILFSWLSIDPLLLHCKFQGQFPKADCDPSSGRHTTYGIHSSAFSRGACSFFSRVLCMRVVLEESGGGTTKIQVERGWKLYSSVSQCFLCARDRGIPVSSDRRGGFGAHRWVTGCAVFVVCYFTTASPFWGTSETLPFAVMDGSGLWFCHLFLLCAQPWSSWAFQPPLLPFWYGQTHHTSPGICLGCVIQRTTAFIAEVLVKTEFWSEKYYKICALGTQFRDGNGIPEPWAVQKTFASAEPLVRKSLQLLK